VSENKKYILKLSCKDTIGIVAAVSGFLSENSGFIIESAQLGDDSTGNFFMRTVFEVQNGKQNHTELKSKFTEIADKFKMQWELHDCSFKPRILLMVSKQGHCLNGLLHRYASGSLNAQIPLIISNHEEMEEMANWYKIPYHHLPVTPDNKQKQEQQILDLIKEHEIELTVLARYMQVLSSDLVDNIYGRAINIHHSFLPSFKGAKPYHQAFERGVKIIGATAHYVSNDLDEGPIIEQEVTRVDHTHTPEQLLAIGQDIESMVLARAVKYHTEHRVLLNGNKTVVFG
jgi:formyltetrahydrofolate deformylase